jgi:hypothetical protein
LFARLDVEYIDKPKNYWHLLNNNLKFMLILILLFLFNLSFYESFHVKSSRVPDIIDSDLLEILHSCYAYQKKKLGKIFFFLGKRCPKYGSSKFDQIGATQFLWRLISRLVWHLGRWFWYHWKGILKFFMGMLCNSLSL